MESVNHQSETRVRETSIGRSSSDQASSFSPTLPPKRSQRNLTSTLESVSTHQARRLNGLLLRAKPRVEGLVACMRAYAAPTRRNSSARSRPIRSASVSVERSHVLGSCMKLSLRCTTGDEVMGERQQLVGAFPGPLSSPRQAS